MQDTRVGRRIDPGPDLDYVIAFQQLARVNLCLRKHTPDGPTLLRKALLESALGDHARAAASAQDALDHSPGLTEASYVRAEALLCHALTLHGLLTPGPGCLLRLDNSAEEVMREARAAFRALVANGREDPDALARVHLIDALAGCKNNTERREILTQHEAW